MTLNIVLLEPQIPQNTGNIARTCAATGARLHLVGPMGFVIDDRKLKRAGLDYWHLLDISYYSNTEDFFSEISGGALSGATPDTSDYDFIYFSTKSRHIYSEACYKDNCFIFFGSEIRGIDEVLLRRNFDKCVRLPMLPGARSLNLSNTVAIAAFEVLRQWGFPEMQKYGNL